MKGKESGKIVPTLVAVIILVSLIAIVSIIYNFLGGFYYCRVISFNKVLGEEQTIEISGEGAYVSACNFSGSLVVGANIKQLAYVQIGETAGGLYLRAKFEVDGMKNAGTMFGFANWIQATDGYLYFNQQSEALSRVGLCNTVNLNLQLELKSSTNYVVLFIVEASKMPWGFTAI